MPLIRWDVPGDGFRLNFRVYLPGPEVLSPDTVERFVPRVLPTPKRAEAPITLVFAIYVLQAFLLRIASRFDGSEDRSGSAAWGPTIATLALTSALAHYVIAALSEVGVRPFA